MKTGKATKFDKAIDELVVKNRTYQERVRECDSISESAVGPNIANFVMTPTLPSLVSVVLDVISPKLLMKMS